MTQDSTADDPTLDSLADPESLADRDDVEYLTETNEVDADEFAQAREDLEPLGGWAVVGTTNDDGRVLLMDDGSHGWTLPAAPVDVGDDWVATAETAIADLTGVSGSIRQPERVRRIDYHEEDGDGHLVVHHVVLRAASLSGAPVADDPTIGCDTAVDVRWTASLPEDVEGVVADDARLFL